MEWNVNSTLGPLCVSQCEWKTAEFKRKKTHMKNRCNTILNKGPCLIFSNVQAHFFLQIWQLRYSHRVRKASYSVPVSCHCFQSSEFRGENGVTSTELHVGMSPWWQCLCYRNTGNLWSSSSSLLQQPAKLVSGNHSAVLAGFGSHF